MGCDIHIAIEQFDTDTNKWVLHPSCTVEREDPDPSDPEDQGYMTINGPYHGRNYALFARLADVRNDSGIEPISPPKGVPNDASTEYLEWVARWDMDGHSHSYLTLAELLDAFDGVYPERGIVSERDYIRLLMTGQPGTWSGGIWGKDIEIVQPYEFLDLFDERDLFGDERKSKRDPEKRYYVEAQWFNSWKESARDFVEEVVWKMRGSLWSNEKDADGKPKRVKRLEPDQIRACFFFDN
jgi:hypothetical protein